MDGSDDVCPSTAIHDQADAGVADTELLCNAALNSPLTAPNSMKASDLPDNRLRQLRPGVSLTDRTPALGHHVGMIVGASSEKQMVRPNAIRIVAVVEHPEAVWDLAVAKRPGNTGRRLRWVLAGRQVNTDRTAAVLVRAPNPSPAGAKFGTVGWDRAIPINLCPKPLRQHTLRTHQDFPPGVTPRAVASGAGVSCADYTKGQG